jgi:hypothetical protein
MNWPIKIINGGKTPYTGTVHTGLPVPQGVVFVAPNICAVPVAGSPVRYEACATILNRNSDTSARFMLVGVTGTFQPGTTELLLQILPGSAPTTFIPENFMLARTAVFEVDWVDAAGKITKSGVNFQTDTGHAYWIFNAFLFIDGERFWNNTKNTAISRDRNSLRSFQNAVNIVFSNFISCVRNSDNPL